MMHKREQQRKALMSERGQVTIPKIIRDRLGLGPGTVLVFETKDSTIIITKATPDDPVAAVYGCLKGANAYKSAADFINEIRGAAP
jgi:AbrB family looped-hinge helix DNA binding protein